MKTKTKRINITLPESLLADLDLRAEECNLSRSSLISRYCSDGLRSDQVLNKWPELMSMMPQLQELVSTARSISDMNQLSLADISMSNAPATSKKAKSTANGRA